MPEMTWLDATAQADLVRRGEVSPKELADAAIARIEAVNPQLDAVIRTRFDAARLEADDDLPDGPFRGVPILFKDLGCTVAGEPRSEEHTSELQSRFDLVCRLLLEKKKQY